MIKVPGKPKTLFGRLMFSHLLVVAASMIIVGLFLTYLIENYFFSAREWELAAQARNTAYLVGEDLARGNIDETKKTAETLAYSLKAKIRVFNYNRMIIHTIDPETDSMAAGDLSGEGIGLELREIEHVFEGNMYTKKVYGPVMQRLLVAAPIFKEDGEGGLSFADQGEEKQVIGAVTVSVPLRGIEENIAHISRLMLYSGAIGVLVAAIFAFSLSKKLTSPLQKINQAALRMASGDFKCKIDEESDDEIGSLIRTFNYSVDQVEKNIEEQKRLEEFRRNLVANVSHELKAPLASIRGYSELILDGLIDDHQQAKYQRVILDNSIHLGKMVDDLMTLAHLESGKLKLDLEEVTLDGIIQQSVDSVLPKSKEKGIEISASIEPALPAVKADRHRLHEILVNLLDNAVKFSNKGGKICLKVYKEAPGVIVEVMDNGPGIAREELPHIFERFYKADKSRKRTNKGSGLGLSIARQLVELHGGSINVESSPGQGSTFRVILPVWNESTPLQ